MKACLIIRAFSAGLLLLALVQVAIPARAELTVRVGPTDIPRGEASGEQDITVSNGLFALAFAVDSAPPWGVARGGIVDVAIIRDGKVENDIVSLVDFMPNNWSAWPTSYQQVEIVEHTDQQLTVRTRRDWGEVELETLFRLRQNDSRVNITTTMYNSGEKPLPDLLTGYVVWPDGGHLFGVPGLPDQRDGTIDAGLANWSAAYDSNWVLGLHAPFAREFRRLARDRYQLHTLKPGERKIFEAWLQIEGSGDLVPLVRSEIEFLQLPSGTVSGEIRSSEGKLIDRPAVVVLKDGRPYAWAMGAAGRYTLELPAGSYSLYATARAHAPGRTKSIELAAGASLKLDHSGLQEPGTVSLKVIEAGNGKPLDARISIESGGKPLIKFLGDKVFFTELEQVGVATFKVAPGHYQFAVSAGGGFTSPIHPVTLEVKSGAAQQLQVDIPVQEHPSQLHWYAVDLHHHSDVLDGFTPPEYVLRSELASGMNFSFLSDHNSVVNNPEMARLSLKRSIPFIASTELSASWAHFNAYPLTEGKDIDIDISTASVQEVFSEARRLGADVIQANHPSSPYGYFRNLETEVIRDGKPDTGVPGGYDPKFDLIEIKALFNPEDLQENLDTLKGAWQRWNVGKRAYLVGASDVHDIWKHESGSARTYVHIEAEPGLDSLIAALKKGHSYASQGPLIFPEINFGSEITHPAGTILSLSYRLAAVSGLRTVSLIEQGVAIQTRDFSSALTSDVLVFDVHPRADTWYSLIVEDAKGKFAYSNPVWITTTE